MKELQAPEPMRLYIRAKHHYSRHTYQYYTDNGNVCCRVYEKETGVQIYNYYYPQDYYEKLNEELHFNEYEKTWLGI